MYLKDRQLADDERNNRIKGVMAGNITIGWKHDQTNSKLMNYPDYLFPEND